jgi:hypothetical protein
MKIYSPSYKRSDGVKTHRILPEVVYCVHEFEADKYKDYNIEVLPDNLRGNIARVRNYIKTELLQGNGLIIDDDIEQITHFTWKDGLPKGTPVTDCMEFIEQGFTLAEQFGVRLWGLNIVGDKGSYREYTPFSLTNWISGSFMGFLDHDLAFDERLPLKEDLDLCLQTLNVDRKLLRINYASLRKKDHGNTGGCADYRTVQREKEQMRLFQKKWGKHIVREDKTTKGKKQKSYDINPVLNVPIRGV